MQKAFYKYIVISTLLLLLAACSGIDSPKTKAAKNNTSNDAIEAMIIGGRTGGAWSVFSEGIAESIRRQQDGSIVTVEPGSIVENPPTVATNKVSYGLSYAMTAFAAYHGTEPYQEAYTDLRAISVVIPANYYQFIVRADAPYDTLDEAIQNKAPIRLAVDQQGSAGEIITRTILKHHGIDYETIVSWGGTVDHLSGEKSFELMADKRIDAAADALSVPSSDILEAATTMDLKLLALEQETIEAVAAELGMLPGVITAGGYDFQTEDIATVNTPVLLIVNKAVPDEEVYAITKAIYESFDYLHTVHEEFRNLSTENMVAVGDIPLHPGAEKFYKEEGMLK